MAGAKKPKITVGWEEWIGMPEIGLPAILAKVDTGARTSALHSFAFEEIEIDGVTHIHFGVQPKPDDPKLHVWCNAPLIDYREVISSNGMAEMRPFVQVELHLAGQSWPIELSLTNRETMNYRMLLGRTAMEGRIVVDPFDACINGVPKGEFYGEHVEAATSKTLNFGILTCAPNAYSTQRLVEAIESHGHQVDLIDIARCTLQVEAQSPGLFLRGEPLPRYDAIIPRIGAPITQHGLAVVRQCELMGSYVLNGASAIAAARDKLWSYQYMAKAGIEVPLTLSAFHGRDGRAMVRKAGDGPYVLKTRKSERGRGVLLAQDRLTAKSLLDAFDDLDEKLLVQPKLESQKNADMRIMVLGKKVIAAVQRTAKAGDFRANYHQGGSAKQVKISKLERQMALRAAKAMGLRFAGVDIMRTEAGPVVMEVNASPGLEGIESATGLDLAGRVIDYVAEYARPAPPMLQVTPQAE
ncbi:RimK family alpha-L-glutamate ligase [Maritalea mediterranea]|uniref:RimK family alpha-L-glutamate ligase n=1 Tax=Maritalea mediterranea TaxID=2909667 RepID=A0ABS9E7X7_9HYPH|nr:RimK family alpha-L-glutamate ligase [Maritalea mediterranea]MCF4098982.1 RimK family alpha-L-glutamate ligase [Maritalea mediterranea]